MTVKTATWKGPASPGFLPPIDISVGIVPRSYRPRAVGKDRPSVCDACGVATISGPNGVLRRHCDDCGSEYESEKARAHNAVHRAITQGKLEPPTDYMCQDCESDAVVYDHRDYRKPLNVEPVCKRCNKLRLGALWSRSAPLPVEPLPHVIAPDCAAITLMVAR